MSRPVNKVVIVGGGTAGWLTAGLLAAEHKAQEGFEVVLIESPDVSPIGVGEGTWPTMRLTLEKMGISETDFFRECDASFKQGTQFNSWLDGSDASYYHPFMPPAGFNDVALGPFWSPYSDKVSFADAVSPQGRAISRALAPKQIATPEFAAVLNYGYHLDAGKFSAFLESHCTKRLGVQHIRDNVTSVNTTESGDIESLDTASGNVLDGDLFVDCTGMAALLIGETLGIDFLSRSENLFNDRALAVQVPRQDPGEPIASVTLSTARKAGWIWDIALPGRRGVGYTYSSSHADDDSAESELRDYLASTASADFAGSCSVRQIRFRPGHREKLWHRNCVAIGLSGGFVEPLEASALVMIELSAKMLAEHLPANRDIMDIHARRFNEKFRYHWERIIEFLKLHYVLSRRRDTEYWRDNCDPASVPAGLQESLQLWHYQSPWRDDLPQFDELFSAASYQYVLYGMGFETEPPPEGSRSYERGRSLAENLFRENEQRTMQTLGALPTNRELINKVHEHGFQRI
jgi:flavin-dependent dehydrogenase